MASVYSKKAGDVETGQLYPNMQENPEMRWAFIRKVYAIVCMQFFVTIGIATFMYFCPPVKAFLISMPWGLVSMIVTLVVTLILMLTVSCWGNVHPWNYFLMLIFTMLMSYLIGSATAFKRGEIALLAAGLTFAITLSLTLYTFWAAKRGYDFGFLGPFLLCALLILLLFGLIRILFPIGVMNIIYGSIGALLFSAFIIYDTDNLIKRYNYDEYILAAAGLYLDILNLFSSLLTLLNEIC